MITHCCRLSAFTFGSFLGLVSLFISTYISCLIPASIPSVNPASPPVSQPPEPHKRIEPLSERGKAPFPLGGAGDDVVWIAQDREQRRRERDGGRLGVLFPTDEAFTRGT